MKRIVLFILMGLCLLALPVQAAIKLLHEFAGGAADGAKPYRGSPILSGTTIYGMTLQGGDNNLGTIFKVQTNGTGFTLLHEFAGGAADGNSPEGSVILSGSTLYGMTHYGGDSELGTIFKIETDGTGFTLLHEFSNAATNGQWPTGSLTISGSILYGMTYGGGDHAWGTIFKIQTDGSSFTLLHSFAGGADDGRNPYGDLLISGSTLYGMTYDGGDSNIGTIFRMQTDGTGFKLLHEFTGGADDGYDPDGSLILSGTTLYGMTSLGGDSNFGTIFKIQTDGTGFTLMHEFAGGADDGKWSYASLILSGSILYGMTGYGGDSDKGTIFKIETDGTGFNLLHEFTGGPDDGANPHYGNLILSSSTLYGMTWSGGNSDMGTIFSLVIPSPIAADFNGDKVTDLVWRHYTTDGGNTVWLMSEATPPAAECENVGAGCQPAQEEIADVGAELVSAQMDAEDGRSPGSPLQDVYESSLPEGEGLSIESLVPGFPGPFGTISVIANVPLPALTYLAWKIVGTGDFNSDGQEDIVWRYYDTSGANAVWLMNGTNVTAAVPLPALADLKWEIVGVGDFNGNNKPDILWRNKGNGKNMVWLMNGLTRTATVNLLTQANLSWKIVGCGDFSSDGKTDILWRFQGTGGKNQVWVMNGTARQSIVNIRAEANLNWKIAGVGDFDKNGKADIIWRNYSAGGANRIWIMNNTAYVRSETLPAVADLNWKIEN